MLPETRRRSNVSAPTGREGRTILLKSCLVRNLGHNSRTELNALQSTALTTTCISVARSAQSERHHDSDRERGAGVRIGTTNKCNVRTDYIELRKRVREPAVS